MNIDHLKESEKYKPKIVKTLLIGEAPPPSGNQYFYVPKKMSNKIEIEKDRSLPATIFNHYFSKRPETIVEYEDMLNKLNELGIFLMDIVDEPIKIREKEGINKENIKLLIGEIPRLRDKIKSRGIDIFDDKIVFLLARNHYAKELRKEFPGSKFVRWIDFRLSI